MNHNVHNHHCLKPNWPAPVSIHAYVTTRVNGHSHAPYDSFNLASHVGDVLTNVLKNRDLLKTYLNLPTDPMWLTQVHGTTVVESHRYTQNCEADASIAREPHAVCVVLTADCIPILICNQAGNEIAAIHAGWRGLCDGIIEATCQRLQTPSHQCMAWLGPGISHAGFIVDTPVRTAFIQADAQADLAFTPVESGRFRGNLFQIAKQRLAKMGITAVYGGNECTYRNPAQYYSFRREGNTGRMATLIWIA